MKSEIEKLKIFFKKEDVSFEKVVIDKVNELIDHLNSQDQGEDKYKILKEARLYPERTLGKLVKETLEDTPEEWVCPKCGFDDCYPCKNSEDFGLDYCPICSELVKLTTK